jgi:hypothetical protein
MSRNQLSEHTTLDLGCAHQVKKSPGALSRLLKDSADTGRVTLRPLRGGGLQVYERRRRARQAWHRKRGFRRPIWLASAVTMLVPRPGFVCVKPPSDLPVTKGNSESPLARHQQVVNPDHGDEVAADDVEAPRRALVALRDGLGLRDARGRLFGLARRTMAKPLVRRLMPRDALG